MTILGGARKGYVWTNPYITDGLVAMWDGEWNDGGGRHDSTPRIDWKNLVDGSGFELVCSDVGPSSNYKPKNTPFTEEKFVRIPIFNSLIDRTDSARDLLDSGNYDIEICARFVSSPGGASNKGLCRIGAKEWCNTIPFSSFTDVRHIDATKKIATTTNFTTWGWTSDNGITYAVIAGNVYMIELAERAESLDNKTGWIVFTNTIYKQWNYQNSYDIFNIRIYNRSLSAEERMANYDVDKERFGL